MSGRRVRSPERAEDGNDKDKTEVDTRPESGVFLSPRSSIDQGTQDVLNIPRTDVSSSSDNGYHTSTSSVAADPEQCHATFYVSHPSETQHLQQADYPDDILLEGEPDADPDDSISDGEHFPGGANPPIDCRQPTEVSRALEIPGASSFHSAHDRAIHLMDGTPPRSYNIHPLESGDILDPDTEGLIRSKLGYRFTTGCLTNMPAMVQALNGRAKTPSGSLLNTSLRVTSGRLQASNRRADLQRQRTTSERVRVDNDDLTMPRDRSMSAPDIGIQRKLIQKQCAQELRKISDEFFEEFHQKGRRSRAGQSQCTQHASSYPGTSSIKHGLWQSIVQSFSPGRVPSSSSSQPSVASLSSSSTTTATPSSGRPLSGMAGDNIRPRIVITKQNSDVD